MANIKSFIKKWLLGKRFLLVLGISCVFGGVGLGVYRLAHKVMMLCDDILKQKFIVEHKITYAFQDFFSEAIKNDLKLLVDHEFANGNLLRFNQRDLYSDLKEKCCVIKSVSYRYTAEKNLLVSMVGVRPVFMVNNTYVVAENHHLYEENMFSDYCLHDLPNFKLAEPYCKQVLDGELYSLLHAIDSNFWQDFNLEYQGPFSVLVRPKQTIDDWMIIADHKSLFDQEKFKSIKMIQADLVATKKLQDHKKYRLVFDVRFNKRIITKIVDLGRRGRKL